MAATLAFLAFLSLIPVGLAFTAATFPGECMDEHVGKKQWRPTNALTTWLGAKDLYGNPRWTSFHDLLFNGNVDLVTRRRASWFSNTLVLPSFDALEAAKIDDPKKLDTGSVKQSLILRGRNLEGAVLTRADFRKADLEGAQLQAAELFNAQLQGASLERAQLQGASLLAADLQGASLFWAQLQGASLDFARLHGAVLIEARLQGASLDNAQLQGASLFETQLQGASRPPRRPAGFWRAGHADEDDRRRLGACARGPTEGIVSAPADLVAWESAPGSIDIHDDAHAFLNPCIASLRARSASSPHAAARVRPKTGSQFSQ